MAQLLKAFWLPDAQILEEHYRGRSPGWGAILSHYRGDVIHHGYLDLDAGGHDWRDVWAIINHLHYIMTRIILQALGYDGGYQPEVVLQPSVPFPLDWAKPDTMAGSLGYEWDNAL